MPFVKRDGGKITSVFGRDQGEGCEFIDKTHPDFDDFLVVKAGARVAERKIIQEVRSAAIKNLKTRGELAPDFVDKTSKGV